MKTKLMQLWIISLYRADDFCDYYDKYLKDTVRIFCNKVTAKWIICHRKLKLFWTQNSVWLNNHLNFEIKKCQFKQVRARRPRVPFCEKSECGKRKDAAELATTKKDETHLLFRAAATSARRHGDADLATFLMKSPKMKKKCTLSNQKSINFSAAEAVPFLLYNHFSKDQYNAIRSESRLEIVISIRITIKLQLKNWNADLMV